MISDHNPSSTPADELLLLEKTLEKSQEVKDKIEHCAVELSTFNETVQTEIAAGGTLQQVEKTLVQNKNVEAKILECAGELREVNEALAQEIGGRDELNHELMETGQKLSVAQLALSNTQHILGVSEKATEEAATQLMRSREVHSKLRRDITAGQHSEKTLFEEKERLRVTLNHIGDAVITTDMSGNVTYLNPVAETMTGWTSREAEGHPLPEVFNTIHSQTNESATNPFELIAQKNADVSLAPHTVLVQRGGSTLDIEDTTVPIRDPQGTIIGAVLIFHDVTQARDMAAQMTYQASHDALTGLIVRREFERRLEHALRIGKQDGKQHTLLKLDLDQFKIVNDTCGHMAGDELLKQLTSILQARLRTNDTLARWEAMNLGYCWKVVPRNLRSTWPRCYGKRYMGFVSSGTKKYFSWD